MARLAFKGTAAKVPVAKNPLLAAELVVDRRSR
jgi:hypothetical protein